MSVKLKKITGITTVLLFGLTACTAHPAQQHDQSGSTSATQQNYDKKTEGGRNSIRSKDRSIHKTVSSMNQQGVHVVADPDSILVLVNKHFKLPDNYVPKQLVYPDVPFISHRSEKSKMRLVAANALTAMFQAAKKDAIQLAGVSAFL